MLEAEVKPGIYKMSVGIFGPPSKEQIGHLLPINTHLDTVLARHEEFKDSSHMQTDPQFFSSPSQFFEAWRRGYDPSKSSGRLDPSTKGFELQYVTWDPSDPFFEIQYSKTTNYLLERKKKTVDETWRAMDESGMLNGIVLASDLVLILILLSNDQIC